MISEVNFEFSPEIIKLLTIVSEEEFDMLGMNKNFIYDIMNAHQEYQQNILISKYSSLVELYQDLNIFGTNNNLEKYREMVVFVENIAEFDVIYNKKDFSVVIPKTTKAKSIIKINTNWKFSKDEIEEQNNIYIITPETKSALSFENNGTIKFQNLRRFYDMKALPLEILDKHQEEFLYIVDKINQPKTRCLLEGLEYSEEQYIEAIEENIINFDPKFIPKDKMTEKIVRLAVEKYKNDDNSLYAFIKSVFLQIRRGKKNGLYPWMTDKTYRDLFKISLQQDTSILREFKELNIQKIGKRNQ